MRTQRAMVLALAAGGAMTAGAAGQCTPTPWGTVGSGVMAVAPVNSSRAVIGNGSRIELITIPASGTPALVNAIDVGRVVQDIKGFGSSAYAHDGTTVYRLEGLNAATNPLRLTSRIDPGGVILGMAHTLTHVYTWNCETLKVLDFTTPASPVLVASLPLNVQCVQDAAFNNNRLYLTSLNQIHVVNIQNPSAPFLVRSFATGSNGTPGPIMATPNGTGTRLVFWHNATGRGLEIQVVDLASDLATPVFRGRAPHASPVLTFATNLIVGSQRPGRVWSLNLSNPDAPSITPVYTDNDSWFHGFGSINGRWLLAGFGGGFTAVDANQVTLRYGQRPAAAQAVALGPRMLFTTHAYVADNVWGLRTVSVHELPNGPTLASIGGTPTNGPVIDVAYGGGFALTAQAGGAQCWDVSTPAAPTLRSSYDASGTVRHIATSGSAVAAMVRASSSSGSEHLELVDFAPATPQLRASLLMFGTTNELVMHEDLVARLTEASVVLYRTQGSGFTNLSQTLLDSTLSDIAFSENYAYAVDMLGRVSALDITNPAAPVRLHTTDLPPGHYYEGIAVLGDWLAAVGTHIDFYSIHDRTRPVRVASAELPYGALDVAAGAGGFLVADWVCGMRAYWPPSTWAPVIAAPPQPVTACPGGTATFTVSAIAPPGAAFQWQRYANNQSANIPGATQPTLTLTNVSPEDAQWEYRCVVTSACGSATSAPAALRLCYANCDCSTVQPALNVNDFICFQSKFAAGNIAANCDGSTTPPVLNVNDFICFQAAFAAGCP